MAKNITFVKRFSLWGSGLTEMARFGEDFTNNFPLRLYRWNPKLAFLMDKSLVNQQVITFGFNDEAAITNAVKGSNEVNDLFDQLETNKTLWARVVEKKVIPLCEDDFKIWEPRPDQIPLIYSPSGREKNGTLGSLLYVEGVDQLLQLYVSNAMYNMGYEGQQAATKIGSGIMYSLLAMDWGFNPKFITPRYTPDYPHPPKNNVDKMWGTLLSLKFGTNYEVSDDGNRRVPKLSEITVDELIKSKYVGEICVDLFADQLVSIDIETGESGDPEVIMVINKGADVVRMKKALGISCGISLIVANT